MQTTLTQSTSPSFSGFAATIPGKLLIGLSATAVVAAAAHVAIPLPFTPVPFILTPLAVLGVGLALGPVAGFFTLLAYLVEGAIGLPVFSPTGPGGIAQLLGPTGGYLMAYPLVAAIAGGLTQFLVRRTPRFLAATIGGTVAITVLFVCGAAWFMQYAHHSLQATWIASVAPFLPGEAVKILAAAGIYSALTRSTRAETLNS
jgi:biotin transport system substrate-specific component